jgi:hypothetical protein
MQSFSYLSNSVWSKALISYISNVYICLVSSIHNVQPIFCLAELFFPYLCQDTIKITAFQVTVIVVLEHHKSEVTPVFQIWCLQELCSTFFPSRDSLSAS